MQQQGGAREHDGAVRVPEFGVAAVDPEWAVVVHLDGGIAAIRQHGTEVAREAPQGKTVEATGGALFFTFFGVLITPPLFAAIVEGGGSYGTAFAVVAVPPLACGLWLMARARPRGAST